MDNNFAAHVEEIVNVAEGGSSSRDQVVLDSWLRCITDHNLDPEHKGEARILPAETLRIHQQEAEELLYIEDHWEKTTLEKCTTKLLINGF